MSGVEIFSNGDIPIANEWSENVPKREYSYTEWVEWRYSQIGIFPSGYMGKILYVPNGNVPNGNVPKVSARLKSYVTFLEMFLRGCSQSGCAAEVQCDFSEDIPNRDISKVGLRLKSSVTFSRMFPKWVSGWSHVWHFQRCSKGNVSKVGARLKFNVTFPSKMWNVKLLLVGKSFKNSTKRSTWCSNHTSNISGVIPIKSCQVRQPLTYSFTRWSLGYSPIGP